MPERLITPVDYILNPSDTPLPKTPELLITPKDYMGTDVYGFGGGIGYTAGNVGAGFVSVFENIGKLFAGIGYSIAGEKKLAQATFAKKTESERYQEQLQEKYRPGKVASFMGEVGAGVGQSLAYASMAAATAGAGAVLGIGGGAAGAGASVMSKIGSFAVQNAPIFLSATGAGISSATRQTGELGFGEFAYGTLSGATEAVLENVFGWAGQAGKALTGGSTRVAAIARKASGTPIATWLTKHAVISGILSNGAGEFAEEFLSDVTDPLYQKWTKVNPDAKFSLADAMHSGFVGMFSGMLLGGTTAAVQSRVERAYGQKVIDNNSYNSLIEEGNAWLEHRKAGNVVANERYNELNTIIKAIDSITDKESSKAAELYGKLGNTLFKIESETGIATRVDNIRQNMTQETVDKINQMLGEADATTYTLENFKDISNEQAQATLREYAVWQLMSEAQETTEIEKIYNSVADENLQAIQANDRYEMENMGQGEVMVRRIGNNLAAVIVRSDIGYNVGVIDTSNTNNTQQFSLANAYEVFSYLKNSKRVMRDLAINARAQAQYDAQIRAEMPVEEQVTETVTPTEEAAPAAQAEAAPSVEAETQAEAETTEEQATTAEAAREEAPTAETEKPTIESISKRIQKPEMRRKGDSNVFSTVKEHASSAIQGIKDFFYSAQVALVNTQASMENTLVKAGMSPRKARARMTFARAGQNRALALMAVAQYDLKGKRIGDSFMSITDPIMKSEKTASDWVNYQLLMLNAERREASRAEQQEAFDADMAKKAQALEQKKKQIDETAKKYGVDLEYRQKLKPIDKKIHDYGIRLDEKLKTITEWSNQNEKALAQNLQKQIKASDELVALTEKAERTAKEEARIKTLQKRMETLQSEEKTLRGLIKKAGGYAEKSIGAITSKLSSALSERDALISPYARMTAQEKAKLTKNYNSYNKALDAYRALEKRGAQIEESYVWADVDAEESRKLAEEILAENPDFEDVSKNVANFNRGLNTVRVQSGQITQETADALAARYPHYLPVNRVFEDSATTTPISPTKGAGVRAPLYRAKGSEATIANPLTSYMRQVVGAERQASLNMVMSDLYEAKQKLGTLKNVETEAISTDDVIDTASQFDAQSENAAKKTEGGLYRVSFLKNGERVFFDITKNEFIGLQDLAGAMRMPGAEILDKTVGKAMGAFKNVVTSMNPAFLIRNIFRDLGDGTLQSQHPAYKFLGEYVKSIREIASGDPMFEEFICMGGLQSSFFEDAQFDIFDVDESGNIIKKSSLTKSYMKKVKGIGNLVQKMKNFASLTEAYPRFTEYKMARKSGKSIAESLDAAADVTVNFGRGGYLARYANKYLVPFLNPAIQAMDRQVRLFTDIIGDAKAGENSSVIAKKLVTEFSKLVLRAGLLSIVPMVFNNLIYDDDDDYKDLRESEKEQNYLFKIGDKWFKIPKGRVQGTIAGIGNRIILSAKGEDAEWGSWASDALKNVTPFDSITRTIFSPFADVKNNVTWYGGVIEDSSMSGKTPSQRYDDSTSAIAKAIGKAINYSPKKIDYLLDQYGGIFADVIIPATSKSGRVNVISSSFTVNTAEKSKIYSQFNDLYEELTYQKNDGDEDAAYKLKYLNKYKTAVRNVWKQIDEINNSDLSSGEKEKQRTALRAIINQIYKSGMQDYEYFESALEAAKPVGNDYAVSEVTNSNYASLGLSEESVGKYALTFNGKSVYTYDSESKAESARENQSKSLVYAEATRLTSGAEEALKAYNKTVYEKAQTLNSFGIDYDLYYDYYFKARYYSGETKRQNCVKLLHSLGVYGGMESVMLYVSGYKSEAQNVKDYVNSLNISSAEKKKMLQNLGID